MVRQLFTNKMLGHYIYLQFVATLIIYIGYISVVMPFNLDYCLDYEGSYKER